MTSFHHLVSRRVALAVGLAIGVGLMDTRPSRAESRPDSPTTQSIEAVAVRSSSCRPGESGAARATTAPSAHWESYTVLKTQTGKDGRQSQQLSYVMPKQYEAGRPEAEKRSEEIRLQTWFICALPGSDMSTLARILGKSTLAKASAADDAILQEGEHVVLTDDQLRRLLTAANKCSTQNVQEGPRGLVVGDRSVGQTSRDGRGTEVVLPEPNTREESRFEVLDGSRFAVRAEIGWNGCTRLDCTYVSLENASRGTGRRTRLIQGTGRAAAQLHARCSLAMPVFLNELAMTAFRKRVENDKPAVDIYVEPVQPARPLMAAFMIIRPVICKAGTTTRPSDAAQTDGPDGFVFDTGPEPLRPGELTAKVSQIDINKATLDDVVRVLGEPNFCVTPNGGRPEARPFTKDNLPDFYVMRYPGDVEVSIVGGRISQLVFGKDSGYVWRGRLRIGSSLADALNVIGPPNQSVAGEESGFREDGVLYTDIGGRKGLGFYARSNQGIAVSFMDGEVASLSLTPVRTFSEISSEDDFKAGLAAKVAQVDIHQAGREDILHVFGKPAGYIYANTLVRDPKDSELPGAYTMSYPGGFQVHVDRGQVQEFRFLAGLKAAPNYTYRGTLQIGSSTNDALAVMGQPDKVAQATREHIVYTFLNPQSYIDGGKLPFEDGVFYRDANEPDGLSFYARQNEGVKVLIQSGRVVNMFLTRTQPLPQAGQ